MNQFATEPSKPSRAPRLTTLPHLRGFEVVRNVDAGTYLEAFLVSAVASMLVIRLYLKMTGFPQVGGGGVHIAHMLWGGLLMMVAVIMLVAYLGKRMKRLASIIGGIGFGAFIDELGKFITSDNNYFYRPTTGIIYVIFIGLFLVFRWIDRRRRLSRQELLVNAADMVQEVILDGASSDEIGRALKMLQESDSRTELADAIRAVVLSAECAQEVPPSLAARCTAFGRRTYDRLIGHRRVQALILLAFTGNAFIGLIVTCAILISEGPSGLLAPDERSLFTIGQTIASAVVSILTVVGTFWLPRSRINAYRWYKRSVLTTIFFVQVFLFVDDQFAALGGLAANLVLLSALNVMLRAEFAHTEHSVEDSVRDETDV